MKNKLPHFPDKNIENNLKEFFSNLFSIKSNMMRTKIRQTATSSFLKNVICTFIYSSKTMIYRSFTAHKDFFVYDYK